MLVQPALLGNVSPGELVLIFLVLLLVFGPRLPEVGRALGLGIKEFKDGLKGEVPEKDKNQGESTGSKNQEEHRSNTTENRPG
jgi:TatA/E family protein of Tat protein translocase